MSERPHMTAVVHDRYGGPERLRVERVPVPEPGPGEVRVRVRVATVNRTDTSVLAAKPFVNRLAAGLFRPRRRTPGCEFAGTVDALGPDAERFRVGDRIFGYTDLRFGTHAEYVILRPGAAVARIPDGVPDDLAACAADGYLLAGTYFEKPAPRPGDRWLINGATGAIGNAAVQIAALHGLRVTATAPGAHADTVLAQGAERVIDYETEDFTASGERYAVIFDAVGKSTFARCRPLLEPGGLYQSTELGPWGQNPLLALVTPPFGGRHVRFPIPKATAAKVETLAGLLAEGRFRPLIDRRYPLADVRDAFTYAGSGRKVGHVLLDVAPVP